MDNQHRKIAGYRELSQDDLDLINMIKAKAEEVGHLCDVLSAKHVDMRWLAIGKTNLQHGFMDLTRAVAMPSTF